MRIRKMLSSAIVAGIVLSVVPTMSFAIGGASTAWERVKGIRMRDL